METALQLTQVEVPEKLKPLISEVKSLLIEELRSGQDPAIVFSNAQNKYAEIWKFHTEDNSSE